MKKTLKTFVAGILCGALIMGIPALANSIKEMIEVTLNTITVKVNGTKVEGDNILYNDTTYVPLRKVAEMLGKNVKWDDATKSADICDKAENEIVFAGDALGEIEGKIIYKDQLDMYISLAKAADANLNDSDALNKAKENIVFDEAIVLMAKESGIVIDNEFYDKYNAYVEQMNAQYGDFEQLLNAVGYTKQSYQLVQEIEYLKSKIIEKNKDLYAPKGDELAKYYEDNKEYFKYDGLIAKHILLSTQNEDGTEKTSSQIKAVERKANEIYAKINRGGDFDALMKEHSEDPGLETYPDGYTFTKGEMVEEFEKAAYALEIGEVSKPVKSQFGYHIIKLVDKIEYFDITDTNVIAYINSQIENKKLNEDIAKKADAISVKWNWFIHKKTGGFYPPFYLLKEVINFMVEEKLTLGEKIKELRRAVGMSQLELANKIKVGKTTISNYENGYSIPTFDIREKLADALDASLEYFLSDEEIDNLSDNHIYFSRVTKIPVFEKNSSYEIITSNQNRYIPRYLEIPSCKNVRTGNFVSIQCPDNAMDNLNIKKGDFIVIETIESIPCLYNKLSFYLFKLA